MRLAKPIDVGEPVFPQDFAGLLATVPRFARQPQQVQVVTFQFKVRTHLGEPTPGRCSQVPRGCHSLLACHRASAENPN
jgi:hypothetical protein